MRTQKAAQGAEPRKQEDLQDPGKGEDQKQGRNHPIKGNKDQPHQPWFPSSNKGYK